MKAPTYRPAYRSVEGLVPYQTGKPIEEVARELGLSQVVKLASNESPMGMPEAASRAAAEAATKASRYPDGGCYELKRLLARKHGIPEERIVLGNGSNDILELLAQLLVAEGDETVYAWPAFIVYRLATMAHGGRGIEVPLDAGMGHDLDAMARAITARTRIVFIANPNNPTGTYVTRKRLESFLDHLPHTVVPVLDEAYFEYAIEHEGYPDGVAMAREGRPLAVLRTFSKAYGLAGLRVGYAVMPEGLASLLNRIRQPFNVSSVAQAAAAAALGEAAFVGRAVRLNSTEMERVTKGLEALGLSCVPSAANFILVDLAGRNGEEVFRALLKLGVIVRPMAGYDLPKTIRVTIGLPEENGLFLEAMSTAIKKG